MVCEEQYTSESPLLISDATDMGKKEYENFRESMIPNGDSVSHFIAKKSIVRLIRKPGRGEDYLNVEVLGEAEYNKARAKGHFAKNAYNKHLPQAKRGQKGFIHKGSLLPSDDFIFVVAKDSAFVGLPSPYDEAKAFRIAKNGNKYKVNHCCSEGDSNNCFDYPMFEVKLEGGWSEVNDDLLNSRIYCGVTTETRPIEKNQYEAVLNILAHPGLGLSAGLLEGNRSEANANDLYYVDSRGLVMLPHLPAERGVDLTEGPYGSFHYTGGGQDIQGDDAYLAPYAACGFMAVMREWNRRYPDCSGKGCGISWGNCSHSTHVASVKGRWPSRTHGHGHCIDIRLFTTTASSTSSSVYSRYYNRNRVVEFLQLARAAGATTIYLEDVRAARQVHKQTGRGLASVLTKVPPHKDHMHVCFSHRSTDRRSSFADPSLPATNSRLKNLCQQDAKDALAGMPSQLLGTDVVATAGIETPDFVLPENIPIPRPRPRPDDLIAKNDPEPSIDVDEARPVTKPESVEIKAAEPNSNVIVSAVEDPPKLEVTTIIPTAEVNPSERPVEAVTVIPEEATAHPEETAIAETNNDLTVMLQEKESLSDPASAEEVEPALNSNTIIVSDLPPPQQESMPEVLPQPENDPFEERSEEVTISDIIDEEIAQVKLGEKEKEKYYGEELSEVVEPESSQVTEGDVVKDQIPSEDEDENGSLSLQTTSPPASETVTTTESNISSPTNSYFSTSRRPTSRYDNERRPTGHERQDDELSEAVAGAYEPVTTPEESSGFNFFSIFTGIFEAIANLFRGLFGG